MAGVLEGRRRILIIGSSGAGKSTLARALGQAAGLPVVHLDKLWWLPGWQNRSKEEFDALLGEELEKDAWIIDGNYDRTLETRLRRADCVIRLAPPRLTCVAGVLGRIWRNRGRTRPDMGEGCPERVDWAFLRWVWHFPEEEGARAQRILARWPQVPVITLRSRRAVNKLLREVCNGHI